MVEGTHGSRRGPSFEIRMSEETVIATTEVPVTTIAKIGEYEGKSVTLKGWLYNLRESGKLLFPIFRDGSGTIQGIVPRADVPPEVFGAIKGLTQESSVIVTGKVRADKRAPGGYELDVEGIEVIQRVPEDTPFPSRSRNTAPTSSWSIAICGFVPPGRRRSFAFARRSSRRPATSSTTED